jgi:hypothetical protein
MLDQARNTSFLPSFQLNPTRNADTIAFLIQTQDILQMTPYLPKCQPFRPTMGNVFTTNAPILTNAKLITAQELRAWSSIIASALSGFAHPHLSHIVLTNQYIHATEI